ncbi:MAG: hypothetical protein J5940_03685 [Clostridia bacterium]|nr:hypothetical protein [Clostridia bacterium]
MEKNREKDDDGEKRKKQPSKQKKKSVVNIKWTVKAFVFALVISVLMALASNELLTNINVFASFFILAFFVLVGVLFDVIGIAVTAAEEKSFHSMAAHKVKAGRVAIDLIRRADMVASICNDLIGDIAGVVSGAVAAAIAVGLFTSSDYSFWLSALLTGLVSAFTVGSKAAGKGIALKYSNKIVYIVARVISVFRRKQR